ncbi:hypothetical protein GCM10010430_50750 [Kitasatospora cystarginea]|uniref:Uncharacterized protein n=1 Tax=Kitasatospora cystarginea TaxID=58350 RepID=A0ABP5RFL0_9ACTN
MGRPGIASFPSAARLGQGACGWKVAAAEGDNCDAFRSAVPAGAAACAFAVAGTGIAQAAP